MLPHSTLSRAAIAAVLSCGSVGCVIPAGYRTPSLIPRSIDYERAEAAVHDPFPITDAGPEMSARPREFTTPRPEPVRAKTKAGVSSLRNQYGTPVAPVIPGASRPIYPEAVR